MRGMRRWKNHGKIVIYHHVCKVMMKKRKIMMMTDGVIWALSGDGTSYDNGIGDPQQ
jgi:hypothetical protein